MFLPILLLATVPVVQVPGLAAGACPARPMDDDSLARRFAPTLHFAPGERDFPTIPFYPAFDGTDWRSESSLPRIAAYDRRQGPVLRYASWDSLYQVPNGDRRDVLPVVLYRVRMLEPDNAREMWRFLRKDLQAWRRFEMDRLWPASEQEATAFKAVEYYFYYLNDTGLEGHKEDIEFVFVFLPADPLEACRFRITVGAGHDPRTPNNVLVRFGGDAASDANPIFVELGGHASAPRLKSSGSFEVGRDVNWHANDVWGTRDILAVSGLGFSGPYRPEMTFDRDRASGARTYYPRAGPARDVYRLVPVAPLEQLSEAIGRDSVDHAAALGALRALEGPLVFTPPDTLTDALIERLRTWNEPLWTGSGSKLPREKHQVWQHRHYRSSPALILKEHLYRPSIKALKWSEVPGLITYGFGGAPDETFEFHAGFVMPTIWTPLSLRGFLEFQAGAVVTHLRDGWDDAKLIVSALYDNDYRGRVGWYTRLSFTESRAELLGEEGRADWTASIGASVLLWSFDRRRFEPLWWAAGANALRVRLGARTDLSGFSDLLDRIAFEIQLSFRQ